MFRVSLTTVGTAAAYARLAHFATDNGWNAPAPDTRAVFCEEAITTAHSPAYRFLVSRTFFSTHEELMRSNDTNHT